MAAKGIRAKTKAQSQTVKPKDDTLLWTEASTVKINLISDYRSHQQNSITKRHDHSIKSNGQNSINAKL